MASSLLLVEVDDEGLALTLNRKKKKIRKKDFIEAINRFLDLSILLEDNSEIMNITDQSADIIHS
jgi:hypothetical protein